MSIWNDSKSALSEITEKQKSLLVKAEREGRGLSPEEERSFQDLQRTYDLIASHTARNEPILPLPKKQFDEIANTQKRSSKMETTKYDLSDESIRNYVNYAISGKTESRTLQKDLDTMGGFLVIPETVVGSIIQDLDNQVWIRNLATKYKIKADSVGLPTLGNDVSDLTFTGEISPLSLDTAMDFEKRALYPHRLCKGIKWSRTLNSLGAVNVAQYIQSRLIYKLAVVEENCFLNGTGAGQPLGLFTVSDSGVGASRNCSDGNSTTEVKADGLINAAYFLKSQYLADKTCRWIFSRPVVQQIKKLKNGSGDYLYSLDNAGIARILGIEVCMSEYAPSVCTTGKRIGILGPLSCYGIAEHDEYKLQTLTELYSLENCNASLIEKWIDGSPLIDQAFVAITLS